jgi:hypothetical protein
MGDQNNPTLAGILVKNTRDGYYNMCVAQYKPGTWLVDRKTRQSVYEVYCANRHFLEYHCLSSISSGLEGWMKTKVNLWLLDDG